MGVDTGSTRTLSRRPRGQARLIRNSTDNGDAAHTTLSSEVLDDSNTTARTLSAALPGPSRRHMQRQSEMPPPEYDDLFPAARAAVSRHPAKSNPSPPKGMDPLVAAMWHNENLSLLHSLPDHLLLKVIGMLSKTSLECIRRVARRFPPLCVREVLNPLRGGKPRVSETGPLNWPRFGTTSHLRPQFLGLVDRDEYCGGCQAARKSPRWEQRLRELTEYIHCSACSADHPACLFSATQRLKPARLRYCIAHEGYMRICDHDAGTIRLPRLLSLVREHKQPWYQRQKEGYGFSVPTCRHPSHKKPCTKVPGGSFPKPKGDCGSRKGICIGHRFPQIVACHTNPNIFDLRWTAHIPFNGEMDDLRLQLAEIQDNAGKYIVPCSASAKELPELRCFDPNDCHCISYPGMENVHWEWECGPWLPGTTKCISDPYKGLNALLPPRPSASIMSTIIRSLKSKEAPKCMAGSKSHQSRLEPMPSTYGPGRCAVDARPCHIGKDCLKVDYIRAIRAQENGKITPQWYNTIDPGSYNITDDQDGLGVYWCSQPRCRNYHKRLPNYAGILHRREYRKECRDYDCP